MKRTLMEWRRSATVSLLAVSIAGGAVCLAADSPDPAAAQQQPIDAATRQLMAANGLFTRGLFKMAAEQYTDFLAQNPSHAQATAARYALAVCDYRLRDFDKAIDPLHTVLADPKFDQRDEALAVLGHCELSLNHNDQALAALDELLAKYPTSKHAPLAALNRAQVLYLAKKYPDAAKSCEAFLAKYPQDPSAADALYFLALSQKAQNDNEQAVKTLGQLTDRFPGSLHQVDALLLTGQSLESLGKQDAAIDAYKQMLAAAPETRKPDALYSLGLAQYKAGQYDDAAKQLTSLSTDYPNSPYAKPAKLQLGLSQLGGGKIGPARQTLTAVANEDADHANAARYGLAQCDIAEKNFQLARQRLDELMRAQPAPDNIAQIALDRAVCDMQLKQFQQASDELEAMRGQYPSSPLMAEATYRQAFCLHKLGKFEQSHTLCQQVAKLPAGDLSGPNSELDAEDLFLMAKYPEAEKQFAELATTAKDDARKLRFQFRQGQCEYFTANYAKAAELLGPIASDEHADRDADLCEASLLLGDSLQRLNKNAEAINAFKHYLQVGKAEPQQAQYKLGICELQAKDIESARASFDRATQGLAESPWVQRAWYERGQMDLKDKHNDQAAEAFRRVLSTNAPADVAGPAEYQLGWAEFEAKRYEQAANAWKVMAATYPNDKLAPDATYQQGVALREAKQYGPAADVLTAYAAAHLDGEHAVRARQLAAACLKDSGKNDQAEAMLASLATQAKGAGADSILYDLAWAQRDAKDIPAAETTYQRLLSEHADSSMAPAAGTELAELLFADKKYDQAAAILEKVVAAKFDDPKLLARANYRLGSCYEKLNQPEKAAAIFATYSQTPGGADDMNASALVHAGLAFANDGKFDKAEQALAEMLQKYSTQPDAPVALLKLGEVQAEQQKFDASAASYQQFLEKYPKNEFVYRAQFGVGWAMENLKRFDEARKAYQKAIAATNGETAARSQFQIGETYLAEGKFEQAVPALLAVDDVYKYPTWSARALFEAGRAFEQLKQNDQARKQYTDVLTKYKDSPEAGMAQDRLKSIAGS